MAIENIEEQRVVSPAEAADEQEFYTTLRPHQLKEFIGQEKIKDNLRVFMQAAQKRKEPIDHVLLYGPPGLGKTTLANIIAAEMSVNIRTTSGPAIERAGDLGSILTNLNDHDILFIDEIHRLNRAVEEVLYPAMEDHVLDIVIGKGPSARSLRLDLPRFSLIGATTRVGMLSSPLRDRFDSHHHLDYYKDVDIEQIISRSAKLLEVSIEKDGICELAKCSRKTPRIANRLLKRVRDYAEVEGSGDITKPIATEALKRLEIDQYGLDQTDRKTLETIIEHYEGGPVGVNALAASSGQEIDTIEEVIEPFLLQIGFITRTPRGRVVTKRAYEHLGKTKPNKDQDQQSLLE
ncbi:Holliday junction branch migration DNA helicase RuvB [Patescibacteria group bacterium]